MATSVIAMSAPIIAQADQYIYLSYGYSNLDDSGNSGQFPDGFTTGAGTTVPAGTALPTGTSVGWNTEFDSGDSFSIAYGRDIFGGFRGEYAKMPYYFKVREYADYESRDIWEYPLNLTQVQKQLFFWS